MDKINQLCNEIIDEAKTAFVLTALACGYRSRSPALDSAFERYQAVEKAVMELRKAHDGA